MLAANDQFFDPGPNDFALRSAHRDHIQVNSLCKSFSVLGRCRHRHRFSFQSGLIYEQFFGHVEEVELQRLDALALCDLAFAFRSQSEQNTHYAHLFTSSKIREIS